MKKAILISLAMLAALPALGQGSKAQTYNVLIAGGSEANKIRISLAQDGRTYAIDSLVPLEVGGTVCANPEGEPNRLVCAAPLVASFEVNSGSGDDALVIARNVSIPVTLRGGAGNDVLVGGSGNDKLLGGPGDDQLVGRGGEDWLYGGPGDDRLIGGPGADTCIGGPGKDRVSSCEAPRKVR
jgi:Ca2+-binding RTX toxin-like protein